MRSIKLYSTIKSNSLGYAMLADELRPLYESEEDVLLELWGVFWIDANLCAVIGVYLEYAMEKIQVSYRKIPAIRYSVQEILRKNGFGKYFNYKSIPDQYHSTIKYMVFGKNESKKFGDYIDNSLLEKEVLPIMSKGLKKQISKNLQEIFGNAPMHGNCKKIVSCGQVFHKNHELRFTIANVGNTIEYNVRKYFVEYLGQEPPKHSIEWAVIEDHSTKAIVNGKSGGKGLAFLEEFIEMNGGSIVICSGNEIWEYNKTGIIAETMYSFYYGTIVTIDIKLNDKNTYTLDLEEDDELF